MLYPNSARFLLLLCLLPGVAQGARGFSAWEEFDLPHPICERPIPLSVGQESFFEIANEVPGRDDYNRIIRLYRKRDWGEFERGLRTFQTEYEASPLREAVTYLEVQAAFDQEQGRTEETEKAAEKKLRSALLLYPKSELAPVLSATAGAFWLRTGNYQRSLAIYELSSQNYPKDPLYCTFLLGIGETHFLLRDWTAADSAFKRVLNECTNFRLRAAAEIRQVDSRFHQGQPGVEAAYERLVADENPFIERIYQPVLANLGEIKYRAGKWKESSEVLERYLKMDKIESDCRPLAAKRLGDLGLRNGETVAAVMGRYLIVHERAPQTDIGRFSYAHALMMDPKLTAGAELKRRIQIVDNEANLIKDEDLRSRVYVEKGLTLLDAGETSALGYLFNLRNKTRFAFEKGKSGEFIRKQIIRFFEDGKMGALDSDSVFAALESEYSDWLRGTPESEWAVRFYARLVGKQLEQKISKQDFKAAFDLLERWRQSSLWNPSGPPSSVIDQIGLALLNGIVGGGRDSGVAMQVLQSRTLLEPFLSPKYSLILKLADYELGGVPKFEERSRDLSSLGQSVPKEGLSAFRLASARLLRFQGQWEAAEQMLTQISERPWKTHVRRERIALAQGKKDGARAFSLLKEVFLEATADRKPAVLKEMQQTVDQYQVWSKTTELLKLANQVNKDPDSLLPFYELAGRGCFEAGDCKGAISHYEEAIKNQKVTSESRFRLGKCWMKQNQPDAAKKEWEKVVAAKDGFWSSLAQSEIRLLSR